MDDGPLILVTGALLACALLVSLVAPVACGFRA
jgi:hypothetical protein